MHTAVEGAKERYQEGLEEQAKAKDAYGDVIEHKGIELYRETLKHKWAIYAFGGDNRVMFQMVAGYIVSHPGAELDVIYAEAKAESEIEGLSVLEAKARKFAEEYELKDFYEAVRVASVKGGSGEKKTP